MAHKLKLVYFDTPNLAEASRYLLSIGGLQFEDFRFHFAFVDGKFVHPEFDAAKAAGEFPFGQVPVLEVDGVKISQSKAIERFIAREIGLLNGSPVEVAVIESFGEQIVDLRNTFNKARYTLDEGARKVAVDAFNTTELPKQLAILENAAGDGFFVGGKLSLADIQFFSLAENFDQEKLAAALAATPKVAKIYAAVGALPAIVAWKQAHAPTA